MAIAKVVAEDQDVVHTVLPRPPLGLQLIEVDPNQQVNLSLQHRLEHIGVNVRKQCDQELGIGLAILGHY